MLTFTVSAGQSAAVGTVAETGSAFPLGRTKTKVLGTATETGSAVALARVKARTVAAVAETDVALSLEASGGASPAEARTPFAGRRQRRTRGMDTHRQTPTFRDVRRRR